MQKIYEGKITTNARAACAKPAKEKESELAGW